MPPEPEPCIFNVTGTQEVITSADPRVQSTRLQAEKEGLPLDCMWVIRVQDKWKVRHLTLCASIDIRIGRKPRGGGVWRKREGIGGASAVRNLISAKA